MQKKYESICESFKNKNHSGIPPHLYLNGRIFWVRFELPKVNGKRRFKRFSLRTDNYYEARQMVMDISDYTQAFYGFHSYDKNMRTADNCYQKE